MLFWFVFLIFIYTVIFLTFKYKKLRFIPWFILFLFSAFRYNVGTDYAHYYHLYIHKDGMFWYKEWGYVQLVNLLSDLGFNPQMMFFIFSFFTIYLFYKGFQYLFKHNDTLFLFATLLFIPFFYFYTLNGIRQALAVAIFFYSIKYIINRNFLKYFSFMFIALLFHRSAIILIPLYFFFCIKLSNKKLVVLYIMLAFFMFYNPIEILANYFISNQLPLYYYFTDEDAMSGVKGFGKILAVTSIIIILILSSFLDRSNRFENAVFNMLIIFALIKIISLEVSFLDRFSLYFKPVMIIFIILVLKKLINIIVDINKLFYVSLLLLSFSYTLIVIYIRASSDESYNQYAIDLYLFGNENGIVQIYRDADQVKNIGD